MFIFSLSNHNSEQMCLLIRTVSQVSDVAHVPLFYFFILGIFQLISLFPLFQKHPLCNNLIIKCAEMTVAFTPLALILCMMFFVKNFFDKFK